MIRRAMLLACFLPAGCAAAGGTLPATPATAVSTTRQAPNTAHAIAEFVISQTNARNSVPYQIVMGADHAMWFTEEGTGAVGRIDARGRVRTISLNVPNAQPEGIALGSDGALYVAENEGPSQFATHVARVTTGGDVRSWNDENYMPQGVAAGANGRVWFTQSCGGLAYLDGSKGLQRYPLQGIPSETNAIVEGPDGAIWFAQDGTASIGRIDPSGTLTSYPGFRYQGQYSDLPHGVVLGSDGNLWWTALVSGVIWAMDPHGNVVHTYKIPSAGAQPWGIASGPDGALWFTEYGTGKIGRVTTGGAFAEYAIPTKNAKPQGLAFGPDGKLWFVESGANRIGRIDP